MRPPRFGAPLIPLLALLALLVHCGSSAPLDDTATATADAGVDATADAGSDATSDAGRPRVTVDAGQPLVPLCASTFDELPGIPSQAIEITAVATGDFNGDGTPDVAAGGAFALGHGNTGALIALGNHDGTFASATFLQTAGGNLFYESNTAVFAAGDFNGDGKSDLLTTDADDNVVVSLTDGDGGTATPVALDGGTTVTVAAAVDVNGDGKLDVLESDGVASSIGVMLGRGDGTFASPVPYASGGAPSAILPASFDSDPFADAVVLEAAGATAQVAVMRGGSGGVFGAPVVTSVPGAISIALLDANGDGKSDLAVANATTSSLELRLGAGDGTFGAPATWLLGSVVGAVATGDVDGDGHLDAVVSTSTGMRIALASAGSFATPILVPVAVPAESFTLSDLNGDHRADLVMASATAPVSIRLAGPGGAFAPLPFAQYATGHQASALAAADLNGDGTLDLAVTDQTLGTVSVLTGTDGGAFAPARAFPTAPTGSGAGSPIALLAADFNGDGARDLVALDSKAGEIDLLANLGDGGFAPPVAMSAGGTPNTSAQALATGDWNGDGNLDLAVADTFGPAQAMDGNLEILFGHGDGTFTTAPLLSLGVQPAVVASADLQGNGVTSLIAASLTEVAVITFDTNDTPTVTSVYSSQSAGSPGALATGDLDGDGVVDLALGLTEGRAVGLLKGNGDGTFQAPVFLSSEGAFPLSLTVADLDGDARADFVGVDGESSLLLFRNQGGGAFASPAFQAIGDGPLQLVVADFNRDGALDLASANGAGNVSVLLARSCPDAGP